MPTVTEIAAEFREALINQDSAAIGEMARRWLGVEGLLVGSIEALVEQVQAMKEDGATAEQIRWRLLRLDKYRSLLAQIGQQITLYNQRTVPAIEETAVSAQLLARQHAAGLVEVVSNGRINLATDRLPAGVAENIAAIARAGQPLYNLLQNAYPAAVQGITNELIFGVTIGRNPRETARVITRKGMAQGLNHILVVARDQQIRNYREMVRQQYAQSEVITGYVRLAAKNSRTCLACLALDSTVYDTAEVMALHAQDRCSQIPIVRGFPRPAFQTGEVWFRSQPPALQKKMMGPGRFDAWQNGRFQFGQLVTVVDDETWGPSAQVTTVTDLLGGKGGIERARL
jgi:hypothetical protein